MKVKIIANQRKGFNKEYYDKAIGQTFEVLDRDITDGMVQIPYPEVKSEIGDCKNSWWYPGEYEEVKDETANGKTA